MRITRLLLRNYRVYEDPVELELPPGLVGVYGPNGAGKSALVEAIPFVLWGRSRTPNADVRTSGVGGDCVTEVEFEHEGHLYVVRRTITGANATVRAQAHADGLQVAEGGKDIARYVRSVLGMDDAAFRASVFAEQKQVAAFSELRPAERRDLVLRLLGIMPLDEARDQAKRDARSSSEQHERLRAMLIDLGQARAALAEAEAQAERQEARSAAARAAAGAAAEQVRLVAADHDRLAALAAEHEALVADGRLARAAHDRAAEHVQALEVELVELTEAEASLAELASTADGLEQIEQRLHAARALAEAREALAAALSPADPGRPDEAAYESARGDVEAVARELAELEGSRQAATAASARAAETVANAAKLSGEAACPLCGQELGDAAERVHAHRVAELAAAEDQLRSLEAQRRDLEVRRTTLAEVARAEQQKLGASRSAWSAYERAVAQRSSLEVAVEKAAASLDPPLASGEIDRLVAETRHRREAAAAWQRVSARVERRPTVARDLERERLRATEAASMLETLREKVRSLAFDSRALAAARQALVDARSTAEAAVAASSAAAVDAASARTRAEEHARRLVDATEQHDRLAQLGDESRHLSRLGELLSAFRNTVVASIGPRLAAQAAELFAELTDREYDDLLVDPETYEIRIRDAGVEHAMSRFSGSETDLANLAVRIAISEHVRFQSGGEVGLLVLDEVFGPLDTERKARMLQALERLRGRFRQILVVTHDAEIKEQLPNAIEVVKLPGRRARAQLLGG